MFKKIFTKERRKKAASIATTILIVGLAIVFLEAGGLWGLLIYAVLFALWRAWVARESLLLGMMNVETTIFGKPLSKDCWEKGEMKNLKLKLKWRKNNESNKLEKANQ